MKKALAIDVGGTKIFNAIINEYGEIISDVEKNSTPKSIEGIKTLFQSIIQKYENQVDIVAFSTCGTVNNQNTKIIGSTGNIVSGYSDIEFEKLSNKLVFVANDANCAAWAEYKIGASKNCPNSVMITLGTGVGGGIIVENKLLKGKSGGAGEMHFRVNRQKNRECTCGARDCFEIYASGTGLRLTAIELSGNKDITTYDVIENKDNNPKMLEIFNQWQDDIIAGLIGLANIFDPDCIVLSGSLAEFVDTNYMEKQVNSLIVTSPTKIFKAQAGNYSGMIGAALLGIEKGVNSGKI